MKYLSLIRHAKSDWNQPELSDFDRPLNQRGEKDAPMMARWLAESAFAPDLFIVSPAVRALTTARILVEGIGLPATLIVEEPRLYGAELSTLRERICRTEDHIKHLAVVAHNPGLTELANEVGSDMLDNLPTCGVLTLELPIQSWQELNASEGRTLRLDFPKKIKAQSG